MHRTDVQVRFCDTDALGHLNNASYASYVELARLAFLRQFEGLEGSLILARLAIDYRRQVKFGEQVHVETFVESVGRTSITLLQPIFANGVLAVDVSAVVVHFDYAAQRPRAITDEIRAQLLAQASSPESVMGRESRTPEHAR